MSTCTNEWLHMLVAKVARNVLRLRCLVITSFVIIKKNVEEGFRGEQVALVLKDLHTQYRFVYPSQSKDAQRSVDALNHFIGSKDDVQVVYTDNSPELLQSSSKMWTCNQTSIEYVDSSKSFAEREVRQMLKGARSNLLQSGLPLKMWPLGRRCKGDRKGTGRGQVCSIVKRKGPKEEEIYCGPAGGNSMPCCQSNTCW